MTRLATLGLLLSLAACPAGTKPPPPPPPAAAPLHEPIDVPVVNASRSEELQRLGVGRAVWTGSEVLSVSLGTTSLWLIRLDAEGHQLAAPIEVPLGHPVAAGSHPTWVDGTIAAVYEARERSRLIRVRPSGEVVVDRELDVDNDWFLSDNVVAQLGAAGFAVVEHPRTGDGSRRLVWFDLAGQRQGAPVDLGCSIPYALTGLTNGFSEEEWAEVHLNRTPFSTTGRVDIHRELHAMRGERREDIDGTAFYELVGRPDLADAYRTRRKVRIAGLVTSGVGAAVAIYGLVSFATAEDHTAACDWESPDYHDCFKAGMDADHAETMGNIRTIGLGMGIAVVGGLVWRFVAKDPVDNDTRRGLAAVYNRELRERLGIPEVSRVEVNPYASASGGGIAVSGQF